MLNDFGKNFNRQRKYTVEECERISVSQIDTSGLETSGFLINRQMIPVTQTECNYGGERVWFVCPACNGRVGTLYRKPLGVLFLCRSCQNLTYQLQRYHRSPAEQFIRVIKHLNAV